MGTVFQYVADHALDPCGGETCHHCGRTGLPIYRFTGEIVNPALAADPQLAADDPVVYELWADRIRCGNVRKDDYRIGEMMPIINLFAADRVRAVAEYHHLPDIPLFLQRDDWPMCCGGWCEFVGCPATYDESRQVPARCHYWQRGPVVWTLRDELMPESLREVSLFRCSTCSRKWFTWQYT